jgi:hypothetical protein
LQFQLNRRVAQKALADGQKTYDGKFGFNGGGSLSKNQFGKAGNGPHGINPIAGTLGTGGIIPTMPALNLNKKGAKDAWGNKMTMPAFPQINIEGLQQAQALGDKLKESLGGDLSSSATKAMDGYNAVLASEAQRAVATALAAAAQMKAALSFTARPSIVPTITPNMSPSLAPPAAPSKHTSNSRSITIQNANFHGVQNTKAMHAALSRESDRAARGKVNNSLSDIG